VRETFDNYRADAATNLLTNTTAAPAEGRAAQAGGAPDAPSPAPTAPKPRRSGPPRRGEASGRLTARLDIAHLHAQPGEATCEIDGLGPVSLAALHAALPEPWVQLVITRGHEVLHTTNIGTRGADLWQQAAIDWSQPRCTAIGCNRTARLQNDHRTPYATKQETALGNLDRACTWHHFLITHRGYTFEAGTGRRQLLSPEQQAQRQQAAS
jgi:hypothetical protein